jgi:uncharacterized protein
MISPVKLWRRQKYIPKLLGKTGKIVSWTIIRTPPKGFKQFAPYIVALVEFADGTKMSGQVADVKANKINFGMKVIAILRKIRESDNEGVIEYGIKFKVES